MSTVVDLWFRVRGATLPSLHGYALYGALCRVVPELHEAEWLGVHTFHGDRVGDRLIQLPRGARLGLRLPADRIAAVLKLAGSTLDVGGHALAVGVPEIVPLVPAASVSARMVTIKGFEDAAPFAEAARRQLDRLEVGGELEVGPRLVQRVGDRLVVGFAARVHRLEDAASLRLQERGIGGRRRMGCGLFRPRIAR